jgi:hypothetical protein
MTQKECFPTHLIRQSAIVVVKPSAKAAEIKQRCHSLAA